uniref:Uncharacterized protein n=1 Tax=Arundo donax TaxID=35708 RepID=A0A0A9A0S7_ARUDO
MWISPNFEKNLTIQHKS